MARIVSFLVLVAILVVIATVFFRVMAGFFVPLFLAALLGVVVQPLYRRTLIRCRGYRYFAAGVTTALIALIVLLPIGLVVTTATVEGLSLLDKLRLSTVRTRLDELRDKLGLQIPRDKDRDLRRTEAVLRSWREKQRQGQSLDPKPEQVDNLLQRVAELEKWLTERQAKGEAAANVDAGALKEALTSLRDSSPDSVEWDEALFTSDAEFREFKRNLLGGVYRAWLAELVNPTEEQIERLRNAVLATSGKVLSFGGDTIVLLAKLVFGMLIMVVALFFLLAEGSRMQAALINISPLEEQHVRELVNEFDRVCRAIVSATLLSALAQGLLAGIGFYVCGLRGSVTLLTLLTMVLALIPITGAAAVWVPVALYLYFFQGSLWTALGFTAYGMVFISGIDNLIKPLVLHGHSKLHPLLALLSVIGGIQALGPIGILVGPMAVVFLQTLLKILHRELMAIDRSSWAFWKSIIPTIQSPAAMAPAAESAAPPAPAASTSPAPAGNGCGGNAPRSPNPPQQSGKKRKK